MTWRPEDVIDLDRYPIHDPSSGRYRELLDHCRAELGDDGCCRVPDFFRAAAMDALAAMAGRLASEVHRPPALSNLYGGKIDESLPEGHPRRTEARRGGGFICADRLDEDCGLWTFFNWPATTAFMMEAFDRRPLYQYADPLSCMAVNAMWEGDEFPWHFDTNELTVSVMLTAPEAGGVFEYVPDIRTQSDENYGQVKRVLEGDREWVRTLELHPGDMQLFEGRYTLHRVTEVHGTRARNVALPSWSSRPDQVGVVERMINSYGRALPIHYERAGISPDGLKH